jgi:hypothetical protein
MSRPRSTTGWPLVNSNTITGKEVRIPPFRHLISPESTRQAGAGQHNFQEEGWRARRLNFLRCLGFWQQDWPHLKRRQRELQGNTSRLNASAVRAKGVDIAML